MKTILLLCLAMTTCTKDEIKIKKAPIKPSITTMPVNAETVNAALNL